MVTGGVASRKERSTDVAKVEEEELASLDSILYRGCAVGRAQLLHDLQFW